MLPIICYYKTTLPRGNKESFRFDLNTIFCWSNQQKPRYWILDFWSHEMKNFSILQFWAFLHFFQMVQADLISLNRYYNTLDGHNSGMMDALVGGGVTSSPASTPTKQLLNRYIQFELSNMQKDVRFSRKVARLQRLKEMMNTSHSIKLRNYLRTMKVRK